MTGNIFLLGEDGNLKELREEPYDSEELLQRLLAQYPNLLAGDQSRRKSPGGGFWSRGRRPCPGTRAAGRGGTWTISFWTRRASRRWSRSSAVRTRASAGRSWTVSRLCGQRTAVLAGGPDTHALRGAVRERGHRAGDGWGRRGTRGPACAELAHHCGIASIAVGHEDRRRNGGEGVRKAQVAGG